MTTVNSQDGTTSSKRDDTKQGLGLVLAKLLMEGLRLYAARRPEEALERWRHVLRIQPGEPHALRYLRQAGERVPEHAARPAPSSTFVEVMWADASPRRWRGTAKTGKNAPSDTGCELFEVLRDRAAQAAKIGADDYALRLLDQCLDRRPNDGATQALRRSIHGRLLRRALGASGAASHRRRAEATSSVTAPWVRAA